MKLRFPLRERLNELTSFDKEDALKRYQRLRDKIVFKYLKHLRAKAKAAGPVTPESKKYERISRAYWETRLAKRQFWLMPENWKRKYMDYRPAQYDFRGPIELNVDSPRYGLVKEGWYFLVLDGKEPNRAVRFNVDEENAMLEVWSYDPAR